MNETEEAAPNKMHELYGRLRDVGLPRRFVRELILPEWWVDEAGESAAGYLEALWTISRHIGIDAGVLRDPSARLELPTSEAARFKLQAGTTRESVATAQLLASQVAKLALPGAPTPKSNLDRPAATIRADILESGQKWVGFEALLKYCWDAGIPVLHVSHFPRSSTRRMDGMAVNIDGRHAIILTKNIKHPAWLLFHLAHELGHVARGHVGNGETFVDDRISEESDDPVETEANRFAIEIITGRAETRVLADGQWPSAKDLARDATTLGESRGIDPGHLILNYAHSMSGNFFAVANQALKLLPSAPPAPTLVGEYMAANLDWSRIPTESAEYISRMTGHEL